MKKYAGFAAVIFTAFAPQVIAGNIANCEVVLMETIKKDGKDTGGHFASFRPAAEFMSSVYDDADGYATTLDGHEIRGVMCTRSQIIPTLRDFPILATGLPFSVSENFDAPDSSLMTIFFKDGKFHRHYSGAKFTQAQLSELTNVMEIFNLQPHNLNPQTTNASLAPSMLDTKK